VALRMICGWLYGWPLVRNGDASAEAFDLGRVLWRVGLEAQIIRLTGTASLAILVQAFFVFQSTEFQEDAGPILEAAAIKGAVIGGLTIAGPIMGDSTIGGSTILSDALGGRGVESS
jgi:hypothetical protein